VARDRRTGRGKLIAKHDGYRLMAQRRNGVTRLLTRNGYDWTQRFPAVAAAVAVQRNQIEAPLDGASREERAAMLGRTFVLALYLSGFAVAEALGADEDHPEVLSTEQACQTNLRVYMQGMPGVKKACEQENYNFT